MSKPLLNLTSFLILLCVICAIPNSQAAQSVPLKLNSPRMLAGYYATPGTFNLVSNTSNYVQSNPGVYVPVYFADKDGGSGDLDFAQKQGIMMLGLYTSQTTLVIDQCEKFQSYNCSAFSCKEFPDQSSQIVYPDFQVTEGYLGNAQLFIDTNYWNLNTTVTFATDCEPFKNAIVGYGMVGVIGMGITGNAFKNYATTLTFDSIMGGSETFYHKTPPVFSIFLNEGGTSGDLIFENDAANKATSTTPVAVLSATPDWVVENVTGVTVGSESFSLSTNLIFDINSNALGFPLSVYQNILDAIDNAVDGLSCPSDVTYRPQCTYKGGLGLLPSIYINVSGHSLEIPGTTYAEIVKILDLPSDNIILNLRGLSSENKDRSYISDQYQNYIILDSHVMGYYYTVFDTSGYNTTIGNNTVNIRVYHAFFGSSSLALTIILVCTVVGVIVGLAIYRYRTIKKAQRAAARSVYGASGPNYVELDPMPNRLS